jgi:hypothetical protein
MTKELIPLWTALAFLALLGCVSLFGALWRPKKRPEALGTGVIRIVPILCPACKRPLEEGEVVVMAIETGEKRHLVCHFEKDKP